MDALNALTAWESFYVIVGSSAAALTGLMFVVITLIPESRLPDGPPELGISAYSTPTVIHLCAALFISSALSAPWPALWEPAVAVSATGASGLVYGWLVVRRVRRQIGYTPVFEDWLWHTILPIAAYVALTASGFALAARPVGALFGVGVSILALLFVGIHNAWDTVTYLTVERVKHPKTDERESKKRRK